MREIDVKENEIVIRYLCIKANILFFLRQNNYW